MGRGFSAHIVHYPRKRIVSERNNEEIIYEGRLYMKEDYTWRKSIYG